MEGGEEEQTCPRAAATLQDRAVALLAHGQDKPCVISPTRVPPVSSLCRQKLQALSRAGSLRDRAVGGKQQPPRRAEEKRDVHPPNPGVLLSGGGFRTGPCHQPAPLLGRVSEASYATEEITAEAEAKEAEKQSVLFWVFLISNPAV